MATTSGFGCDPPSRKCIVRPVLCVLHAGKTLPWAVVFAELLLRNVGRLWGWTDVIWLRIGPVTGSCEQGNQIGVPQKAGNFLSGKATVSFFRRTLLWGAFWLQWIYSYKLLSYRTVIIYFDKSPFGYCAFYTIFDPCRSFIHFEEDFCIEIGVAPTPVVLTVTWLYFYARNLLRTEIEWPPMIWLHRRTLEIIPSVPKMLEDTLTHAQLQSGMVIR
jgi:hypothetical protein